MKTACPACGAVFSLDALLGNEGAREAVMAAMQFPAPVGWLLIRYLALFRPGERQLSMDRVASLLNELLPMIQAAQIERNGRIWSAPQDYWKLALEDMISKRDKLTLPLKSHGYLLEIIAGYSNKAEAKEEIRGEQRKTGRTDVACAVQAVPVPAIVPPGKRSVMPDSVKAALKPQPRSPHGGNDDHPR